MIGRLGQRREKGGAGPSLGESVYLVLFVGVALVGWLALVLAELGLFSLPRLFAAAGAAALAGLAVMAWRCRPLRFPRIRPRLPGLWTLSVLAILLAAALLYCRPSEYVLGGRDHGVYINTGTHIARTGGLAVRDAVLAGAPAGVRSALTAPAVSTGPAPLEPRSVWDHGVLLPGFYVTDQRTGESVPHGFHLYPAYCAVLTALGGVRLGLIVTPLLALVGLAGATLVARRLFGPGVALVAALLLVANLGQIWYAHTPSAEVLLQALFWGAMLAFLLMLDTGRSLWGCIGGAAFGMMHLAKIESYFIPVGLALFLIVSWLRGRWRRAYGSLLAAYCTVLVHAVLHAALIATPYTLNVAGRTLPATFTQALRAAAQEATGPADFWKLFLGANWHWLAAGVAFLVVVTVLLRWARPAVRRLLAGVSRTGLLWRLLGAALILGGAAYSYYVAPASGPGLRMQWLAEFGWYMGGVGLLLAVAGFALRVARTTSAGEGMLLLFLAGALAAFVWLGSATYGDHFWAFRRFVPLLLPAAVVLGGCALSSLWPGQWKRWPDAILPLALGGVWLAGSLGSDVGFLRLVEYRGVIAQVEALAERFPREALILVEGSDAGGRVATPLRFIGDRLTYLVQPGFADDPLLAEAVAGWLEEGREVYWIGTGGAFTPEWAGVGLDYQDTMVMSGLAAEQGVGYLPHRVGEWAAALDLFRLTRSGPGTDCVLSVDVGDPAVQLDADGLYQEPPVPGLTTAWWTGSQAEVRLHVASRPSRLLLRLAGWPSVTSGPSVAVTINGQPVGQVVVGPLFEVYSFTLPTLSGGEDLILGLASETWNPRRAGYSSDDRDLGVRLDWIRLVADE